MSGARAKIRLFVAADLAAGMEIALEARQAHHLATVMRRRAGEAVALFNGRDGEWLATLRTLDRKGGLCLVERRIAEQWSPPDLWLLFAPIRKARMDMVIEKAVELGAARLQPVLTRFTQTDRLRRERMVTQTIEAAEQCGALTVPEVAEPVRLADLLADWPTERALIWCDEQRAGTASADLPPAPAALLVGPEGGLAPEERTLITDHAATRTMALGPRILRAETAAIAALTLWQAQRGDWR
ncbi:MAG: 16S rRNA (uracil(1498)-N(3))-methyltransferase [Pseudomonadota bacterium]